MSRHLGLARLSLSWPGLASLKPHQHIRRRLAAESGSIGPTLAADSNGASEGQTLKHEHPRTASATA